MKPYAAPAAFLLAVTAAVLAIHYGLQTKSAAPPRPAPIVILGTQHTHVAKHAITRTYVVQRGDSFSVIAAKTHTSVARLEHLNPSVSSTALRVGQRIRVK
ncbi:MAG TPA: LysM domain-containing protein [Gaiellaceae bacterium]